MNASFGNHATGGTSWLKRVGVAGLVFFFAKGLVWLVLPLVLFLTG